MLRIHTNSRHYIDPKGQEIAQDIYHKIIEFGSCLCIWLMLIMIWLMLIVIGSMLIFSRSEGL